MNIFFYPASVSTFSEHYFKALQFCITAKDLFLLPGGCGLTSPQCLSLRSGDILILYAENDYDIERLLALHSDVKDFRVLLLLGSECTRFHRESVYILSPIFVAEPTDFKEFSTVVMNILLRNDDQP